MSEEQQMCDVHPLSAEITCENGRARWGSQHVIARSTAAVRTIASLFHRTTSIPTTETEDEAQITHWCQEECEIKMVMARMDVLGISS